jgi:hypothetical protein
VQPFVPERVQAMAVFKEFVATAQREFVAAERTKNPAAAEFAVRGCCAGPASGLCCLPRVGCLGAPCSTLQH